MGGGRVADDILRGLRAIGYEIGLNVSQTRYGIEHGHVAATKNGGRWEASRSQLRREYRRRTQSATQQVNKGEGARP
jgi:hypothetical protein